MERVMRLQPARIAIVAAVSLTGLAGCSNSSQFGDLAVADTAAAYAMASPDITGSIATPAAASASAPAPSPAPPQQIASQSTLVLGVGY
jgi:hypothetical protein